MEVQYKVILTEQTDWWGLNPYIGFEFKVVVPNNGKPSNEDACCYEMKRAWNDKLVGVGEYSKVELPEVQLQWTESTHNGDVNNEYKEIYFCPWCGGEITVKEIERVKRIKKEKQVTETKTVVEYEDVKIEN